jgi:type II secretory pathway pseudopilin PulG
MFGDDFMKIHLRKGFTLVLVIFVLAILMILATFTLTFMVNENRYAIYHENATKAEYIAMNGADIVEAALVTHLEDLFGENGKGVKDINAYLDSLNNGKHEAIISDNIEGLEKVEIYVSTVNDREVLTIDSIANYNGVSKGVRKILWSEYVKSIGDNIINAPLIVKNEAYLVDKGEKVDLTNNINGKIYAQKMVDISDFPLFTFPDPPKWNGTFQDNTISIKGRIEGNINYDGNVLVEEELTIKKGVNISVRGNLTINANIKNTGTGDDVNFYVYNEGNKETALEIDPPKKGKERGEVNANFYVQQGKIDIILKQAVLNGDIVSNDKFSGVINNGNLNQKDYNIKLIAEDNSKKINFNGSIYAPEAYILIGGSIESNDKNAINQNGVIVGSYIEINGRNENKNDYFIDNIYNNFIKAEGIELPVGTPTEYNILNYFSYYIDY